MIDVESLVQPISDDLPSGESLEYDQAFMALETAAQRKEEQQFGDNVIAGEEPDWGNVKGLALELAARTQDVRVDILLARAVLHTDGFGSFRDGLSLLRRHLEEFWATVHPQLDEDDDNDPTMRVNALVALTDRQNLVNDVRTRPLVDARGIGAFSLRDIAVANGEIDVEEGQDRPDAGLIDGAFAECELDALQATATAIDESIENLQGIEVFVTEQLGVEYSVNLDGLSTELKNAQRLMNDKLGQRGVAVEADDSAVEADDGAEGIAAPAARKAISGEITCRDDVTRMIDSICKYYGQYEPSSPVPILLKRAKRLVPMEFMDIVNDLVPDAQSQAKLFAGNEEGSDDSGGW